MEETEVVIKREKTPVTISGNESTTSCTINVSTYAISLILSKNPMDKKKSIHLKFCKILKHSKTFPLLYTYIDVLNLIQSTQAPKFAIN